VSGFDPTAGMPLWFARTNVETAANPGDGRRGGLELACVLGQEHPYRHVVRAPPGSYRGQVLYRARYGSDGEMSRVVIDPAFVTSGMDLWFTEFREAGADPPATNLVAFATPDWPDGTIVPSDWLKEAGVDPSTQVGAVRWWTTTGQVHQVYVAAEMRRRRIGTKLVLTGAALTVGRRWPSLWSRGDLTDLGVAFVDASAWSSRVAPQSRVVPPMTPDRP
jgi:GNAT superfamily N-acetyltransferase